MKNVIRLFSVLLLFVLALTACQNKNTKANNQTSNEIKSEGIITVDGIDLEYKIEGSGTPIMVLGAIYPPLFSEKLREHCQFIFVDTRCFIPIESPPNIDAWTMDTYVDDIETIRKTLKLEKVGVLGHSAFGFLPLEYAIKYPENVCHVIVMGTPPYRNKIRDDEAEKYWETLASEKRKIAYQKNMRELEEKNNSGIERTALQKYFDKYNAETPLHWYDWNYDAAWIFENNKGLNTDVVNNYFGKIVKEYDPSNQYGEIKCPVFIAVGKYDFRALPLRWEPVVAHLGNWTLTIYEKSSHFPMYEEQEIFDSTFLKWLAEN